MTIGEGVYEMKQGIIKVGAILTVLTLTALQVHAAPTAQNVTNALESALRKRITSPGGNLLVKIIPGPRAAQEFLGCFFLPMQQ